MFGRVILKRLFTGLLVLCLVLTMLPASVLAETSPSSGDGASENTNSRSVVNADISLVVQAYDKEPSMTDAQVLTTLVVDGSAELADLGEWEYTETRYLNIQATGIPKDKQYELVVTMQPIIKAMSLPTIAKTERSFTRNTLTVNTNATFSAEDYSGTIVWQMAEGTEEIGFALELEYDITIWDKMAGELNSDASMPLVSVFLREVGTTTPINQVNLHKAQAPETWAETIYVRTASISDYVWSKDSTASLTISRMINGSYYEGYYYPRLEVALTIPKYTLDGNTYYLDVNLDSLKVKNDGGTAECTSSIDEANHTITIVVKNLYITSNTHFTGINFTLPEEVADAIASTEPTTFQGVATMTQYSSDADQTGKQIAIPSSGKYIVNYLTKDNSIVECRPTSNTSVSTYAGNPDVVNYLGLFALQNTGSADSKPYHVELKFDTGNTNAIRVTTVNIMPDYKSENIDIAYEMINSQGDIISGTYALANKYCGTTDYDDPYLRLERSMISAVNQEVDSDYYFKKISYTIASIPAGTYLYNTGGSKGTGSAGTIWGYVVGDAGQSAVMETNVYDVDMVGDQAVVSTERNTSLSRTTKVKLTDSLRSSIYFEKVAINGNIGTAEEVQAGDTFTLSGKVRVTNYPYSYTNAFKNVRVGLMLPQGITFTADDVSSSKDVEIEVYQPTTERPIWVMEFNNDDLLFGAYTESLNALSTGNGLDFSINLHTERGMPEQTIQLKNVLLAAAEDLINSPTGAYKEYKTADIYDLNGSQTTDDMIAPFIEPKNTTPQFTIKAAPALLDITAGLRGSQEHYSDGDAALEHFADQVTYDLKIACTDGGKAKDFFYLIPIAKIDSPEDEDFVEYSKVNLNLKEEPTVTNSGGAGFKLLYTTELASTLTYDYASTEGKVQWMEAEQISDWTDVTMIKVVTVGETIETGATSVISVPLEYAGNNYQYEADAATYAQDAGKTVKFSSRGYYNHTKGTQTYAGTSSTSASTVRLEYTIPEPQKITLTAVKDRKPNGNGSITASFTIDTEFELEQDYGVRMVNPTNVTLVPSTSDFAKLNANSNFGIKVKLNNEAAMDLDESASVEDPIELGNVASKGTATFTFEIFNGNALSDTTTPRIVELDIIGHNGVTIPVVITINVIATPVENAGTAIVDQKEYLPFTGSTSVSISEDSSLTAQFVAKELVPNNYLERTLSFNKAPMNGTTILMIDWTNRSAPAYYYCKLDGTKTSLPLTEFVSLENDNIHYVNPMGTDSIAEETLLFVVDFPKGMEKSTTIALTRKGNQTNGIEDLVQSLSYTVAGDRSFDLNVPTANVEVEDSFDISYSNTAPANTDNYYSNRKMALVISPASDQALPIDAQLVIGDIVYSRNINGQFIIPLGSVAETGTGEGVKNISLRTEGLVSNCLLDVALWVSATSNDSAPMAGKFVATKTFTVIPQSTPSFEVDSMSKRKFTLGEDALSTVVSCQGQDLTDCKVYLEIQQKKSASGYAADAYYLSTLNGVQASMKNDITNLISADTGKADLTLVFSDTIPVGTYRLLFTVQKDDDMMLTVPYNFMILSE